MKLSELKLNEKNPRTITKTKLQRLKKSIKEFPEMMAIRPIVVDENNIVLAGNMRVLALRELKMDVIPDEWVKKAADLPEELKKRFVVIDNVSFGDWDWPELYNEWNVEDLKAWGFDVKKLKPTAVLSEISFKSMYYVPENKREVSLENCFDWQKFRAKIDIVEKANIDEGKKALYRALCYRFLRVDFERIADYYEFFASDEEKELIERLRLVLVDNGIEGFVEDDLLAIFNALDHDSQ